MSQASTNVGSIGRKLAPNMDAWVVILKSSMPLALQSTYEYECERCVQHTSLALRVVSSVSIETIYKQGIDLLKVVKCAEPVLSVSC